MGTLRFHFPLVSAVAAALASYVFILFLEIESGFPALLAFPSVLAFVGGVLYTHVFEYLYHRLVMHRVVPGLAVIRRRHLDHHRVFHGERFTSRAEEDLRHIATSWYLFPAPFVAHYALAKLVWPSASVVMFLTGVLVHYLAFELSHWFIHVEDNGFDRWLAGIPAVGAIREAQILHHRLHHDAPEIDFNFVPPFLGDRWWKTWSVELPVGAAGVLAAPGSLAVTSDLSLLRTRLTGRAKPIIAGLVITAAAAGIVLGASRWSKRGRIVSLPDRR